MLALAARVATLEATVQDLMERLPQDARPSSHPPSSEPPQRQRPRRQPSGRRPSGQPGPQGQTRTVVPVEEVDVVIPLKPAQGGRCPQALAGDDPQPPRQQVYEIPPSVSMVTAYPWPQLVCPVCGEGTRAAWPVGVPRGTYGPRGHAITALCPGA